ASMRADRARRRDYRSPTTPRPCLLVARACKPVGRSRLDLRSAARVGAMPGSAPVNLALRQPPVWRTPDRDDLAWLENGQVVGEGLPDRGARARLVCAPAALSRRGRRLIVGLRCSAAQATPNNGAPAA